MGGAIRVTAVELVRYERRVAGTTVSRALVRLTGASADGRTLTATGEGRLGTTSRRHGGWNALLDAGAKLERRSLPLVPRGTPPDGVADVLRPLLPPPGADPGEQPPGVRQAVELALLDLLTRAHACDLPTLLGRRPRGVKASSDGLVPLGGRSGTGEIEAPVLATSARFPLLRLGLTGDAETDLDGVRIAVAADRAAGRDRPLWLMADRASLPSAEGFLPRLTKQLRIDLLPRTYVEYHVEAEQLPLMAGLQTDAAAALGSADTLRIAARTRLAIGDVARRVAGGLPGVVVLDIARSESALETLAVADELRRAIPGVELGFATSGTASELGRWAMFAVASGGSEVEHVFGLLPRSTPPWLTETRLSFRGESNQLAPMEAPGMAPDLDRRDLAAFISRRVPHPAEDDAAAKVRRINRFPRPSYAGPSPLNQMFQVEALAGGLSLTRYSPYLFTVDRGCGTTAVGFERGRCDTAEVARRGAWSKHLTKELLTTAGFSVPPGSRFAPGERSQARAFARQNGFPLVVKPVEGRKGVGITTEIRSWSEFDAAVDAAEASSYGTSGFIVERFVTGADYRILVLGDKVLSVVLREPAHVVGDGRHTIVELVTAKNMERRRNHHLALGRLIEFNLDADRMMALQGLHAHSVPDAGQRVVLRSVSNQSAGGESTEVLDDTHPSLIELAVRAVAAVPGLEHAGLDVLLDDHRAPIDQERFNIIEMNDSPAMGLHHWVMFGRPRNVTRKVVGFYVRRGGLDLLPRRPDLCVRLTVQGTVVGVGYRAWLARQARLRGLAGWVANTGSGDVAAVLAGPVELVSATVSHAIRGSAGAFPTRLRCEPEPDAPTDGFAIREDVVG